MNKLPSVERDEWRQLLNGEIEVSLENFVLQMKVTNTKNRIKNNKISLEEAVIEIYDLCKKFYSAKNMSSDIDKIFQRNSESSQNVSSKLEQDNIDNMRIEFQKEILRVKEVSVNFLKEEFDKIYAEKEIKDQKVNDELISIHNKMNTLNDKLQKSEISNQNLSSIINEIKSKFEDEKGFFSKMFN